MASLRPNSFSRRGFLCAAASASLVASLSAQTSTAQAVSNSSRAVGEVIALPTINTIDGVAVNTSSWRNSVIVVTKFASWCPFCKLTNPKLDALAAKHADRGLRVLALSIDRDANALRRYLDQHRYRFTVAMWNAELERALDARKGLPVFWVIGRDGRLKQAETGELHDEDVAEFARWL